MFRGMGIQWAATLLGCIAVVLIPIPVIFYLYGAKIRQNSAFAPTGPPPGAPPAPAMEEVSEDTSEREKEQDPAARSNVPTTSNDKAAEAV
jgi:MFS transporter, DHA1 family, multidrug resistance protein